MANDIKLQSPEGAHPVDENTRPIFVGETISSLEIAQQGAGARVIGDLEITGSVPVVKTNKIESTDLDIDANGKITLDSAAGEFEIHGAGTTAKFADIYAGMILGYTRIQNDSTTSGHATIDIGADADMHVLQTVQGTNLSITFVAPPSGNVEIRFDSVFYSNSTTVAFALSDNSSFNEVDETHTYDGGVYRMDETDTNTMTILWSLTGLTAGTSYTYYIAGDEISGSTSKLSHGRDRSTGRHWPPIIIKAIALPVTIVTGE